jgi:hypothetical protein
MPCYRCGCRQVDPDRGESQWRRGVRGDRQVLICPDCQVSFDWTADLDRCPVCGSVHLFRRLGEVECRDCGRVGQLAEAAANPVTGIGAGEGAADAAGIASPESAADGGANGGASEELAREVELALSRVLGQSRQRPPYAMS